ncbi:DUF3572 domain-containing protein [Primorskyibacter sp. S87]|uniref:DUF3572 domain-containing protein n=1 Tax=Primorskyibacter sp. S87 TaxID=3415126 RepID=UPI003C7A7E12
MKYSESDAETLSLRALTWLVGNEDLLPVFLGASGATEADLRARAGDRDFLLSVLDFLMMDDAWIIGFCDAQNVPYEHPNLARAALAGPAGMHWT